MTYLLLSAVFLLAFSNGANDNFKGVASLFGSDTTDFRLALAWGTLTTFLGSVLAMVLARGLVAAFSAKGLVPPEVAEGDRFLLSVAVGAGGTVMLATRLGMPISTTHGLVGAIVGAGLPAAGAGLDVGRVASIFLLPLVASPFVAVILAGGLYAALHRVRTHLGIRRESCLCVEEAAPLRVPARGRAAVAGTGADSVAGIASVASVSGMANPFPYGLSSPVLPAVHMDLSGRCTERYAGRVVGLRWQRLVDAAHFASAGLVSFARGLNDTPKIAALLVAMDLVRLGNGLLLVGGAMAVGAILSARRVAYTMSRRITGMNPGQGLAANLATGFLVIVASRFGLPVSTTHVSVGSLAGIGMATGQARLATVRTIFVAWVVTLPCAAALAALVYLAGGALL